MQANSSLIEAANALKNGTPLPPAPGNEAAIDTAARRPLRPTNGKVPYAGKEPRKSPSKGDRLPVPPPKGQHAAASPTKPIVVAKGTVIDGIDCSGMTDDPKKQGIPVYLQTQNRRSLTKDQQKHIDDARRKVEQRKQPARAHKTSARRTTRPAKASRRAPTGAPAHGDIKAGTKNALMLDMVLKAGAKGVTEDAICQKLGWKACAVTLRRVCERAKVKLDRRDGRFYAQEPKRHAKASA